MTVFKSVFQHCECIKELNADTVELMPAPRILITEMHILGGWEVFYTLGNIVIKMMAILQL